jgi:hypothetical protein
VVPVVSLRVGTLCFDAMDDFKSDRESEENADAEVRGEQVGRMCEVKGVSAFCRSRRLAGAGGGSAAGYDWRNRHLHDVV